MRRLPRNALIAVQLLVSAGFVWGLFRKTDLGQIGSQLVSASLPLLAVSLVTKFCGFCLMALRLQCFSTTAGGLGFRSAFRAQAVAFVGNNVLPLRLGEALKVGFMTRKGVGSLTACFGIAAAERTLDSLFLVLFIAAALLFFADVIPTAGALYLFSAIAAAGFVVLWIAARFPDTVAGVVERVGGVFGAPVARRLTDHARQFSAGVEAVGSMRRFPALVALTGGYWLSSALSVWIWIAACGIDVPWSASVVVLVFVSLATVLPSAPGFVGTYHYFAALALGLFGISKEAAASFAIVGHAVAIIPFTVMLAPLVARDIVALHRAAGPALDEEEAFAGGVSGNDARQGMASR